MPRPVTHLQNRKFYYVIERIEKDTDFALLEPEGVQIQAVAQSHELKLKGPFDNIYETTPASGYPTDGYLFVQIVNARVVQAFKREDILVTDRLL